MYAAQDFEQKQTPSSRSSTLRRNDNKNTTLNKTFNGGGAGQPQSTIYDSIGCKPNLQINSNSSSTEFQQPQTGQNCVASTIGGATQSRPEYLNFERNTLDYRLLKNGPLPAADTQNNIDYRSRNGSKNDEFRLSGSDFVTNNVDYSLSNSNQMTLLMQRSNNTLGNSGGGKNSRQSRNHIITDTLPGPESCV